MEEGLHHRISKTRSVCIKHAYYENTTKLSVLSTVNVMISKTEVIIIPFDR